MNVIRKTVPAVLLLGLALAGCRQAAVGESEAPGAPVEGAGQPVATAAHRAVEPEAPPSSAGERRDSDHVAGSVAEPPSAYVAEPPSAYEEHCGQLQRIECLDLAESLYDEEQPEPQAQAIDIVQTLCFGHADVDGCDLLSLWRRLAKQPEESLTASLEGCELGDLRACTTAGEYLVYGERRGVRGDVPRGLELMRKSCAAKSCFGCVKLLGITSGGSEAVAPDPELEAFAEKTASALYPCLP